MKKFIITVSVILLVLLSLEWLYFYQGVYLDFGKDKPAEYFMKVENDQIYM